MLPETDNLPGILTGIAALATAIGGWTFWKTRKEPPLVGTPDAVVVALTENTKAVDKHGEQFRENMRLFGQLNTIVNRLLAEAEETRRSADMTREHLASIRDILNRRGGL